MNGDFKVYLTAYHSEVTGSRLLLNAVYPDGRCQRILVDCGYYQEIEYRYLNYEHELNPESVDAILITHNHIDHTGLLPKMVRDGYRGPIYMTKMTQLLLPSFLMDSASQQEENAEFINDQKQEKLIDRLQKIKSKRAELKEKQDLIEARLKNIINTHAGILTEKYKLSWFKVSKSIVDTEKLRADNLYEKYSNVSETRTLRVFANKKKAA